MWALLSQVPDEMDVETPKVELDDEERKCKFHKALILDMTPFVMNTTLSKFLKSRIPNPS